MASVYDVYPNELIEKAAEQLKEIEEIKAPEWAVFVKTGVYKERPPVDTDWWYVRAAAILRTVYRIGPVGVNKLKTKYGGKQRRGHAPAIYRKGSGSIIRKCLQQLEKAGFIKNNEKEEYKGRIITGKGKSFLDKLAVEIVKSKPKEKKEVKKEIPEQKKEVKKEEIKEEKKSKNSNQEKKQDSKEKKAPAKIEEKKAIKEENSEKKKEKPKEAEKEISEEKKAEGEK